MLHHLPALLAMLAAPPRIAPDDVDPLAIHDPSILAIWMSEVRMGACGTRLDGRLTLMGLKDDSVQAAVEISVTAARSFWSIKSCSVAGKRATADPESVLAVLAASRHQIRAGIVPAFDRLLFDHTGLRLPAWPV